MGPDSTDLKGRVMNWDEIDGAGAAKPSTLSRKEYQWLQMKVSLGIWLFLVAVCLVINLIWIHGFFLNSGNWTFWVALILGRLAVDASLKARGLSLAGPTVQIWGKSGAAPTGHAVADDHSVEIKTSRDGLMTLGAGCLVVCLPTFALAVGLMIQDGNQHWLTGWPNRLAILGAVALISAGVGAFGCWLLALAVTPKRCYRADASGFQSFLDKKFLTWSEIATCRVTTQHDALGDPTTVTHQLIDCRGKTLLKLKLAWLPTHDRDRLIYFIQAKLPKPLQDHWLS